MLTIFKMQWYFALYIHVPVSHNVPVQPVSQLHWNDPAKLLHEPWTHGDWRHSLMSENSKLLVQFITISGMQFTIFGETLSNQNVNFFL